VRDEKLKEKEFTKTILSFVKTRIERGQSLDAITALVDPDGDIAPFKAEQRILTHHPSVLSQPSNFNLSQLEFTSVKQIHSISNDLNWTNRSQNTTAASQSAAHFNIVTPLNGYPKDGVNYVDLDGNVDPIPFATTLPSSSPPEINLCSGSSRDNIDISLINEWIEDYMRSLTRFDDDSIPHPQ
jgi:hypothetical protein